MGLRTLSLGAGVQSPAPAEHPAAGAGPLTLGSLCTGYGGLDLAVAQVLDVAPAWVADPDPGAAAILAHHWPDVPNLGDITRVDWTTVPPIDVLTAGFPCQDISYAGRGAGIKEGTRSGLWHVIADALSVVRPRLVVLENVAAIVARRPGLDVVLADLAALGFDANWCCVRASDVGAPHRRERWFCIAWPSTDPDRERVHRPATEHRPDGREVATRDAATDPERDRWEGQRSHSRTDAERPAPTALRPRPTGDGLPAADAPRDGRHEGRPEPTRQLRRPDVALRRDAAADPDRAGGEARGRRPGTWDAGRHEPLVGGGTDWGDYAPAIRRWERVTGRAAPAPTEPGRTGPRLSPVFVEWLMGLPAGHVTGVPGLSRNAQLKALGNGVVWQQGAAALAHLLARIEAAA